MTRTVSATKRPLGYVLTHKLLYVTDHWTLTNHWALAAHYETPEDAEYFRDLAKTFKYAGELRGKKLSIRAVLRVILGPAR